MSLQEQFADDVVAIEKAGLAGPELLPERLAHACARVLPVDGASLSMYFAPDRRLPLGASGGFATTAERLQYTVGEGPCLHAQTTGRPVFADQSEMRERWPAFHDALVQLTPVRSVISLPLREGLTGIAVLDLFFVPPNDLRALPLVDGLTISREITASLSAPTGPDDRGEFGPAWLDSPSTARRARVWQALGFLNVGLQVDTFDALSLLRAHAYAHDKLLDEVSADVLEGRISVHDLAPEGYSSA